MGTCLSLGWKAADESPPRPGERPIAFAHAQGKHREDAFFMGALAAPTQFSYSLTLAAPEGDVVVLGDDEPQQSV